MLAVSIGMGVSAFKQNSNAQATEKAVTNTWYEFTGDASILSQVENANYYVYRSTAPDCSSKTYICAVNAPGAAGSGQHPNAFSSQLKSDLEYAFNNGEPTDDILMRD